MQNVQFKIKISNEDIEHSECAVSSCVINRYALSGDETDVLVQIEMRRLDVDMHRDNR